MQVRAKEASVWYQVKVKTPMRDVSLAVPVCRVPRKGEFEQRPDPKVFKDSKACIFIHDRKPYLRIELDPERASGQKDKTKIPQSQVVCLAPYGWKVRDFAAHPLQVRYEQVVFKEPCAPLLDESNPFLFSQE
ncbi:ORF IV [Nyavirus midwayense]|uniref:ORF IV n=1 Tax=Nyavirus midwayense TaxID=644609 RepID=C4NFL1_9MONO|nr:ORF IV [Nyavirus midwayense]ACQ94977.1 ORF IV [Nyavirus midwayense]